MRFFCVYKSYIINLCEVKSLTTLQPTPRMKRRLNIWIVLFLFAFTVWIFISMFKTSITDSAKYQALANSNQFGSIPINANRGSIYDKNGQIIAQSATVFNIIFDPKTYQEKDSKKIDIISAKLLELFGESCKDKVVEKAGIKGTGEGYQIVAKKVEKPIADQLTAFCNKEKISCLYSEPDTKRYYPQGDLSASVVGFLNGEGHGAYGLEKYYDTYLSGVDGRIVSAKDALGGEMPYRYEKTFDAQDGNSIVLTMDITLQHYLEKGLEEAVSEHEPGNRACGIIMNPKTGEILAMASEPGFNLNSPTEIYDPKVAALISAMPQTTVAEKDLYKEATSIAWEKQWKNKAITELYYPGSVFKVVTGSSALEEKAIDLNTKFTCRTENVFGTPFHCWTKIGHGSQNFVQAMTNSCNPAFIQIGQKLGAPLFSKYYAAYGFTEATGIDLPGEAQTSLYVQPQNLGPVELASSSFGQTNKVTPIQMITAYAATINGGKLVTPYVVSKVQDKNGNVIKTFEPNIKRQVISEDTSAIMRKTLESVVNSNGGSNSYIQGYKIGGKSGTSEKQDEDNEQHRDDLYVSSYVGFAPADDPEIIMLVMVDEPSKGEYYGSKVAVPVVTNVFKEALPYLGYYPQYTEEELKAKDVTVSAVEGQDITQAKNTLIKNDLNFDVVGQGTTVIKQVPARNSTMSRGGTVILYTEENFKETSVTVPNVINRNVSEVNAILTGKGLNVQIEGPARNTSAVATLQNWPEGQAVPKGTIIKVTFAINDQSG